MSYIEIYKNLKTIVSYEPDYLAIDDTTGLYNFDFVSPSYLMLPCEGHYSCEQHGFTCDMPEEFKNNIEYHLTSLNIADAHIIENQRFRYHVFHPSQNVKAKEIILMFHGFNEKHWAKYLPWAKRLCDATGKTIVLFPIAFHMNRAPQEWSDSRKMFAVSDLRRRQFPRIIHSTLSNVAISTRVHDRPQRFFWSGLQTYYDTIRLIEAIKAGLHPLIASDAKIDFFAYSIGCLLAEILMMTNQNKWFDLSRLFMFCGGPVFNRISPVSKFILDSEANVALYSFIVEHLYSHLKQDVHLNHYLGEMHPEGVYFRSMLNFGEMRSLREDAFRRIGERVMSVPLAQDAVIPPYEVANTLQGAMHNLPARVETLDFPYEYRHEDPFPPLAALSTEVSRQFDRVFDLAEKFYS